MPGIRRLTDSGIAVVNSGSEKSEVAYCQRCLENNIRSKLGNRVYNPEQSIPPDYNSWRQCHLCGSIYGRYETKQEAELYTLTEPRDNPFKFKSGSVETGESRKVDRSGKTQRKRKIKQDLEQYKEEDLKADLRKGKKLISYHES
jgi:hypothetical protein